MEHRDLYTINLCASFFVVVSCFGFFCWLSGSSMQILPIALQLCPVLVCKKPVRTVGLGDTISATGLKYSAFKRKAAAS
jgi:hypothetical protein